MATARRPPRPTSSKDPLFDWEGKDRNGRIVRGELRAGGEAAVQALLRRQGIFATRVRKRRTSGGKPVKQKDIALFTRQMAAMMRAGVPLLQTFDIISRGALNPQLSRLVSDIRADVETGTSLSAAFRKHPMVFNPLYCSLVEAGEAGGILETLLDRLALYQEKIVAIKQRIRSAMMYPVVVMFVAAGVLGVIMTMVVPSFKGVYANFGAQLPLPTLMVIAASEFFVQWWWLIVGATVGGGYFLLQSWKRSAAVRAVVDRLVLQVPVFGPLLRKSIVARWTRTLATMFAAGVPLVEALESVAETSGNAVYSSATESIQREVSAGSGLTNSMQKTGVFPEMVVQMAAIGEESGSLDQMLIKAAEFFEEEVDETVKGLSTLLEPIIIVALGGMIAVIVIAMYLPLFKLGTVV